MIITLTTSNDNNNRNRNHSNDSNHSLTPSPPTKSFPTKSPRVKVSGRLPIKFDGRENSHPLELRVCLSQALRNSNS